MSIFVAGLTGQTGSGKSTVADIFRTHGVCVIDCDRLSRETVEPGYPCSPISHAFSART